MRKWAGVFIGLLLFPFVLLAQETSDGDETAETENDAVPVERAAREIANQADAIISAQPGDYILLPSGKKYILTKEEIMIAGGTFGYENLSEVAIETKADGTVIKTISQAHEISIYPDGRTVHVLKTKAAFAYSLKYIEENYHLTQYLDSSGILHDSRQIDPPNFSVFRAFVQFGTITNGADELASLSVSVYNHEGKNFVMKYCSAPDMVWGLVSSEEIFKTMLRSSKVSIIVKGTGAVTEIDSSVTGPLLIVQTIPSFSGSGENTYQANAPVVFFFNNKIYLDSVQGNIDVAVDGRTINGIAVINEGANGYAVLTFTPNEPFPVGKEISITMKKELQNSGGNPMQRDINLSYITEKGSDTNFSDNLGFESGSKGVVFTGDGAIGTAKGSLVPYEGSHFAAISTGEYIVSMGAAINSRSSQIELGPIQEPFSTLGFYYDFISAEFNEYVGSVFDDTAMVTIYGPKGTYTEIITSVNMVRFKNTQFSNYPRMPDQGDSYSGHTGWLYHRIENIDVGTPAYIIFTVTDVGDSAYSSILAVDALELK